jgi:hypothetical protein
LKNEAHKIVVSLFFVWKIFIKVGRTERNDNSVQSRNEPSLSSPFPRLSVKTILVKLYSRVINIDWKKEKAETADVISLSFFVLKRDDKLSASLKKKIGFCFVCGHRTRERQKKQTISSANINNH